MIPDKLYYRIGEVEAITEIPAYVLRYWESEFKLLRPKKNPAGQRLYRKKDLELVLRIKTLLYDERLTLEGAKKRLRGEARSTLQMDLGLKSATLEEALRRTPRSTAHAARAPHGRADGPCTLSFACAARTIVTGRGVAQPGSALDWGSRGRWFKSSRPDQFHRRPASRFSDLLFFCGRRRGDRWHP